VSQKLNVTYDMKLSQNLL